MTRRGGMARGRAGGNQAINRAAHLLDGAAHVPTMAVMQQTLSSELERARRYEFPLSVVVLDAPVDELRMEGNHRGDRRQLRTGDDAVVLETCIPHLVSLLSAALLREVLRDSDIVVYDPRNDRLVLLLAHSDAAETRRAVERLRRLIRTRLHLSPRVGFAHFVEDGLTLENLLACAQRRWQEEEAPAELSVNGAEEDETAAVLATVGDATAGGRR